MEKTPDLSDCKTDMERILKFLECMDSKMLHITLRNIERIALYGA